MRERGRGGRQAKQPLPAQRAPRRGSDRRLVAPIRAATVRERSYARSPRPAALAPAEKSAPTSRGSVGRTAWSEYDGRPGQEVLETPHSSGTATDRVRRSGRASPDNMLPTSSETPLPACRFRAPLREASNASPSLARRSTAHPETLARLLLPPRGADRNPANAACRARRPHRKLAGRGRPEKSGEADWGFRTPRFPAGPPAGSTHPVGQPARGRRRTAR